MPRKPEDEKRPRWLPEMLSEAEIEQLRRKAKEDSIYFRKAFAHLRPAGLECLTGNCGGEWHMLFNGIEIVCPKCGSDRVQPRTRTDDYRREWIDTTCESCGHGLTFEEIGRQFVKQTAKPGDESV